MGAARQRACRICTFAHRGRGSGLGFGLRSRCGCHGSAHGRALHDRIAHHARGRAGALTAECAVEISRVRLRAATRADRILSRRKDPEKETEPYRADLANAVRPRRPDAAEAEPRSERPQVKPAPLKLVAEQRVDAAEAVQQAAPAPVRPRRVIRSEEPEAGAKGEPDAGFVEFAESMGATELPELLEAAAAYMSFVEGRDQFSRPQLMTKVRQAELSESSREDRLRSFGQLLREGKIEKTHGGRFTASDRISFKPGKRAAG